MNFGRMLKNLEKLTVDNSPAILTALGVAGVVGTSVLVGKAAVESYLVLEDAKVDLEQDHRLGSETPPLDRKEKVKLVWHLWVLPVSVGTITCTSIVMANRIGTRRAAAMATAYVISERAFEEYREKVVEKLGHNKEAQARAEIAQNQINNTPGSSLVVVGGGEILCIDQFTGRYFKSTMETIKKAQNDTNHQMLNDGYASLTDFYGRIDLPQTSMSEEFGWSSSDKQLDILFSTCLSEDGRPCLSIDFNVTPIRNYHKFL